MLIVPLLITLIVADIVLTRYGDQIEALICALVPMWLCYIAITILDMLHIM